MGEKIGFIGLGIMGREMAKNLLANGGFHLTVFNRTESKCLPFTQMGAKTGSSPEGTTEESDLVLLMLADSDAVERLLTGEDGVLSGMGKGKTLIDMGTNSPPFNRRVKSMVEERGGKYLEAPVLGSRIPAREGTLTILVGGEESSYQKARPILSLMGKTLIYMGEVGRASQMKLVVNQIMAGMVALFSEGMTLGERSGIPPSKMLEVLQNSAIDTPLFRGKGPNMLISHDYYPHFPLKHAQKDLRQALATAESHGVASPVTAAANALFLLARDMGHGDEDFSAVIKTLLRGDGDVHIDY